MKKISFVLFALPIAFACNNSSSDSVQKADSSNESKMDTSASSMKPDTTNNKMSATISVDQSTSDFMVKVADVGMTEVKLGQLVQDKSTNQRVK
ncbi:MAG TPA: hypothetical protein VK588_02780, partial [Chitinophagaceae bacterium]|nr:hypothetical protein [Chitinophagaceae bacterium]